MLDVLVDMTALNTGSRRRGIGRYVASLCAALAARPADDLTIAGLVRHKGGVAGAVDPTLGFAGDPRASLTTRSYQRHKMERRFFIGSLARSTGARLLHLPDPPGTPIDMRTPRVVTCHDLIPLILHRSYLPSFPFGRSFQWARDFARYRTATRVIAISECTRGDLVEQLGIAPDAVEVIHHGVDHERFQPHGDAGEPERVAEALGFTGPYVLYVGAGDSRKNLPALVRAHAATGLAREVPLVLAGALDPRVEKALTALAAQLGSRLCLPGYLDEALVPALYRRCHVHVFPSSYEGFGLPVLEAMACGAPTVALAASSVREVARDAALLVDSAELEPLAAALVQVAGDEALRTELRERGLARARGFTWERCAAETIACYRRVLARA
jgi:glycosyltransferase involved in cell wall biosynthesis